jgi:hypothetical protein
MVNVAFLSPILSSRFGYRAYGGRLSMGGQMSILRYKVAHARQPEIDLIQASMALGVLEGSVSAVRMSLDEVASRDRTVAAALREALNDLAFVSKHLRFAKAGLPSRVRLLGTIKAETTSRCVQRFGGSQRRSVADARGPGVRYFDVRGALSNPGRYHIG